MPSLEPRRLLGLGTALVAGAPIWIRLWDRPQSALDPQVAVWLGAYAVFAIGFWLATALAQLGRSGLRCRALLAVETIAVVVMAVAAPNGLGGALLVVVAAQAAEMVSVAAALVWVVIQTLGFGAALVRGGVDGGWTLAAVFVTFQCFAVYTAAVAARERSAREELGRANAGLRSAQERLAESSRAEERLRLSRELHDVMGHHLTALSLSLEAARHAPADQARELVERAHALNRRLLQDLRRVVSALRDESDLDLARALVELGAGIDQPRLHVTVPDGLRIDDPERARATLRCVQEIVTNTIRHAAAQNLWLELEHRPDGLRIRGRDDGRGAATITAGVGLGGMRERLESLGGRLNVTSVQGQGFQVEALIPHARGAP